MHLSNHCWLKADMTEWVISRAESPVGLKVEQTYIHKRRYWRFDFDALWTSQLQTVSQKQSNGNAPRGVYYIIHLMLPYAFANDALSCVIYIHRRGAFSVVHWKTIFLICYLLDYQQVQENSNVSIILLGDKKEPTKWKTNLVQQILLPNNHFPCYFYFKNRFYWRKEKRCVTCLWLPTKANTQI